ncbi:MAG: XRE family transcriptional regulator [Candidatus Thiodiazotropha sp. (ex Epidulcina cf. delphinae)]|nr:XRE family transcriptional regulator [Candidatus Thiodiazotropha sp. (ex Epidulcina cf. delphinae)]
MNKRRDLTPDEKTAAARLKAIFTRKKRELGFTQETISYAAGWTSPSAFGQYANGVIPINLNSLILLSKLLQVDPSEVFPQLADRLIPRNADNENVFKGPEVRGLVPLISWVQAGGWHEVADLSDRADAELILPCPAGHGTQTFALRVEGDSMTAPHGKSYPEGCIIFVDPDQRGGVVSGNRVIAELSSENAVTFKVYIEDAGKRFLKPLNAQYPPITEQFKILGKVIGKWESE